MQLPDFEITTVYEKKYKSNQKNNAYKLAYSVAIYLPQVSLHLCGIFFGIRKNGTPWVLMPKGTGRLNGRSMFFDYFHFGPDLSKEFRMRLMLAVDKWIRSKNEIRPWDYKDPTYLHAQREKKRAAL